MESKKIEEYLAKKMLEDFNNHLALEQKLLQEVRNMEKTGLQRTVEYKRMVGLKTEQSYFVSYLYRLLELFNSRDSSILENLSPKNMRIKSMIQVWKKSDYKFIRNMRKGIGDNGVNLMKNSVDKSILKVNEYIVDLGNKVKDL